MSKYQIIQLGKNRKGKPITIEWVFAKEKDAKKLAKRRGLEVVTKEERQVTHGSDSTDRPGSRTNA